MTESEKSEARELLHNLWGLHASGVYDKKTDKPLWARLDALIHAIVPEAVQVEECGAVYPTLSQYCALKKGHNAGETTIVHQARFGMRWRT